MSRERRLADVVERARDLIVIIDGEGRIDYVNRAVQRTLGWRTGDVGGRFMLNLVHPDDTQRVVETYAAATPRQPGVTLTHRVRARDGAWRWLTAHAVVVFAGERVEAIELVARDVTEQRAAGQELRRSVGRLTTLVGAATSGVLMEDAERRITVVGEPFCSLFGIPAHPDALVGTDTLPAFATIARLLAEPEGRAERDDAIVEARVPLRGELLVLADGRAISRDYVPLDADAGDGHMWIFRDVTSTQLQAGALREARDEALAAATAKGEFLATMSHEIRTPLSGISGAAALLLDAGLGPAEQELASIVAEAADALSGLLGDVLDVSRIEAGHVDLQCASYDLRKLLAAIAGILRPTLRGRPLELELAVAPSVPPFLCGDAARVRQIVLNLASNAVKYTERGRIRLSAEACDGRVRITIADTGPGIAADLLARLFEPWTRGHGREWAGTGLGLGIARRLARAMEGDVTAVSTPGAGSEFTLELPLAEGAAPVTAHVEASGDPAGRRVLVAEDNHALRLLLARQLARLGVEGTLVADGGAAVAAAEAGDFDAILLDLRMPVLGGLDAARRIRAGRTARDVPILALTADTGAQDVELCRAAGMDGHLAKPVSLEQLRTALAGARPRPAPAPAATWPVLDDVQLAELADGLGGRAAVDELLAVYRADLGNQFAALQTAVQAGDAPEVRQRAHALRSGAAAFGAARLAETTRGLEDAARRGILDGAADALRAVGAVVGDTAAALAARLDA